jgi:glutamate N-acetyltransferase/amino-acid N-acetyltransferase
VVVELRVDIYPLPGEKLVGDYVIADHINLSGSSPRDIGFVPLSNLYTETNGIIVACLKAGVHPSNDEAEVLRKQGVKAYCYGLLEPALYAAANGQQVSAIGFVPRLPKGFKAWGGAAGIKPSGRKDLAVLISDTPCKWAGVFTRNLVRAACVDHNIDAQGPSVRAIVCNSGNANACTGDEGARKDMELRAAVAKKLGVDAREVLSASTGKIGVQLPVIRLDNISPDNKVDNIVDFAEAILTTDLSTKIAQSRHCEERSDEAIHSTEIASPSARNDVHMIGFAKGSGMIAPNMATMLGFIISDARISVSQNRLEEILREITAETFNAISVDNDTSTNDMLLFLTNEQGAELSEAELTAQLRDVCTELAKKIAIDGEGATKLIEQRIINYAPALTKEQAVAIAKTIINSPLVKSAIFGCDPNWGRIMAAAGRAAAELGLNDKVFAKARLSILGSVVYENGMPSKWIADNRDELASRMKRNRTITIHLDLGAKESVVKAWGCDLSYDYVKINAEYFT